jgi:hypothetical protein
MAEDAERNFARTFLNILSTQSITYSDDYRQPPELSLRRVSVLPVSLSLTLFLGYYMPSSLNPRTDYCLFFLFFCALHYIYISLDCCAATPRTRPSSTAIWVCIRLVSFPSCKISTCWCIHFDGVTFDR